jgi:CBS domain-containing protein
LPENELTRSESVDDQSFPEHESSSLAAPARQSTVAEQERIDPDYQWPLSSAALPPKPRTRRQLLLDGRRVTIRDLLGAGLLKTGENLTCRGHHAEVTKVGRIRLDDGQEFATPSPAASAVLGGGSFDGWIYWTTDDGKTLYQLRQQLLESAAREAGQTADPDDPVIGAAEVRYKQLNDMLARARDGDPRTMTVREMLRMWDLGDRNRAALARVEADLENHGLRTDPDYRDVDLDTLVRVDVARLAAATSQSDETSQASATGSSTSTTMISTDRRSVDPKSADIGLTLGNLIHKSTKLTSIEPGATIEQAITIMQLNDYSQLPVTNGVGKLHGVVSWQSIAQATHRNPQATFRAAIEPTPTVLNYDHRLLDALTTIQQAGFVFVRGSDEKVYGIVTAADVVGMYDDAATPFFLIGEIDQELRQLIEDTFDEQTVVDTLSSRSPFTTFEKMTMGQYRAVLENRTLWEQLAWPLDRKIFIDRLGEIVRIRNDIMHFNRDSLPRPELEKLRRFLEVIRLYGK